MSLNVVAAESTVSVAFHVAPVPHVVSLTKLWNLFFGTSIRNHQLATKTVPTALADSFHHNSTSPNFRSQTNASFLLVWVLVLLWLELTVTAAWRGMSIVYAVVRFIAAVGSGSTCII